MRTIPWCAGIPFSSRELGTARGLGNAVCSRTAQQQTWQLKPRQASAPEAQQLPAVRVPGMASLPAAEAANEPLLPPGNPALSTASASISGERKRDSWARWNHSPWGGGIFRRQYWSKPWIRIRKMPRLLGLGQGPPFSKEPPIVIYPETRKLQGISGCAWPVVQFGHPVS